MNKFRAIRNFEYFNQINTCFPEIEIDSKLKKLDKEVWLNEMGELIVLDDLNKLLSNKTDLEENIINKFVIIIQVNSGIAAINLDKETTLDTLKKSANLIAVGKVREINEWQSYTKNDLLLQIDFLIGFCIGLGQDLIDRKITSWVLNPGTSEIIEITEKEYHNLKINLENKKLKKNLITYGFQTQKSCELTDVNKIDEAY